VSVHFFGSRHNATKMSDKFAAARARIVEAENKEKEERAREKAERVRLTAAAAQKVVDGFAVGAAFLADGTLPSDPSVAAHVDSGVTVHYAKTEVGYDYGGHLYSKNTGYDEKEVQNAVIAAGFTGFKFSCSDSKCYTKFEPASWWWKP
jgi:hypothetical protein